jgi:hypothetical protein
MGWSRRAFAASAASAMLAVAGCAGASGDDTATEADSEPDRGSSASKFESVQPLQWWATPPDLAVVNVGTDGVTAYVTIYGPDWLEAQFRETVSLRGPVLGEPAAVVSFDDVDVVGARGVIAVETADGLTNAHDWDDGDERHGIVVQLHDDRIRFADVHT